MKPWKVLLYDTDQALCSSLTAQLQEEGFKVFCVNSPSEANAILKRQVFDVAILDMNPPKRSGLQIFRKLKRTAEPPYFILMTRPESLEKTVDTLDESVDAFVFKPIKMNTFRSALLQARSRLRLRYENTRLIQETNKTRYFYENLLNNTSEAILVVNLDFDIQYCNQAAQNLLKAPEHTSGRQNLQSYIDDGFKVLTHVYQQLMLGKNISSYRISVKPDEGRAFDVNLSADFLQNARGEVEGLILILDNTSLQNELFNRIVRKEKLTTIVHLANALAHEIRNPINILSGRIQLLKKELSHAHYSKTFEIIERQMERISDLTTQLLKFNVTRDDTIPEIFSVVQFIEDFLGKNQNRYPELRIQPSFHPQDRHIFIEANRYQFEDAFHYLFEFLNEYLPKNTVLKIFCNLIKSISPRQWVELKFCINRKLSLESLSEPFKVISHQENYSRFGIAIMHTIFSNYEGRVEIEVPQTKKTLFGIRFPVNEINAHTNTTPNGLLYQSTKKIKPPEQPKKN